MAASPLLTSMLKQASGPLELFDSQNGDKLKGKSQTKPQSLCQCHFLGLNLVAIMQSPTFLHFHKSSQCFWYECSLGVLVPTANKTTKGV